MTAKQRVNPDTVGRVACVLIVFVAALCLVVPEIASYFNYQAIVTVCNKDTELRPDGLGSYQVFTPTGDYTMENSSWLTMGSKEYDQTSTEIYNNWSALKHGTTYIVTIEGLSWTPHWMSNNIIKAVPAPAIQQRPDLCSPRTEKLRTA